MRVARLRGFPYSEDAKLIDKVSYNIERFLLKGQAFAAYIRAKSGRKLAYELVVNNIPFTSIENVIQVIQDEDTISAILWRDN